MKTPFITKALLAIAVLVGAYLYVMGKQTPRWTGPFTGERVVIKSAPDPSLTMAWVYADLIDFKKAFLLEKDDDCFVLTSPEWKWEDAKDPSFTLVPIFCPKKGAGWGDPHILKDHKA